MPTTLHLDYETASTVDLKKHGAYRYAAHNSTRILMLGWAYDNDPVQLWEPHKCAVPPLDLVHGLLDPSVICEAANANFERLICHYCLGITVPYERWRCSLIKAYYLGFAGRLDDVLTQIGLRNKDPRGAYLINRFCKPAPRTHKVDWYTPDNSPQEWDELGQYCVTDVEVERELSHWCDKYPAMHDWDWRQYHLDQRINDRGVPVNVEFARAAIDLWTAERERLTQRMQEITGLSKVTRDPILKYINSLLPSYKKFACLNKKYIQSRRLKGELPQHVDDVLDLWAEKEAKAATKYQAVLDRVSADGRVRGMFQYKGASRTDRAASRGLQLQNLKHPTAKNQKQIDEVIASVRNGTLEDKVSATLGSAIRHVIEAPKDHSIVAVDWSSIESVCLGWLTGCERINRMFRDGKDSYRTFGVEFYNIPYDQITKEQRQFCKPPVLGCGYFLGAKGLVAYAEGYGVVMTPDEAKRAVDTFRRMYPEIPIFWYWLRDSIFEVLRTGRMIKGYRLTLECNGDFFRIRLPSGRNLSYYKPRIIRQPAPWDHTQEIDAFSYMGMQDKPHKHWTRISAHPGGVTENIVQSICSDILWCGITRADQAGINIVLHVHDEPVAIAHENIAEAVKNTMVELMTAPMDCAPGMWLGAKGDITKNYTKD